MEDKKLHIPLQESIKASSTSSLYIDSTLLFPDVENVFSAAAALIHHQIKDSPDVGAQLLKHEQLQYFSEEKYISEHPESYGESCKKLVRALPTRSDVDDFIKAIYKVSDLR